MAKRIIPLLSLFLFTGEVIFAQKQLAQSQMPLACTVTVEKIKNDFSPSLTHFEEVNPSLIHQEEVKGVRKNSDSAFRRNDSRDFLSVPVIHRSFEAPSSFLAAPNDNDIAISNDGYIVSVINCEVHVYDTSGNQLKVVSLDAFADSLKLTAGKFDPRVIYDPEEDRFIIVFLCGVKANDSHIIVAFSRTNNPLLSWNLYAFAGNILNDSSASDFPIVAISKHELFINVSNYDENDFSYNSYLYKGTRLLQIKKEDGFEGRALNYIYHHNFSFEPSIRWKNNFMQLTPVKGGSKLFGPNMYLLATYDGKPENDTIFLVEITDTIGAPDIEVKTKILKTSSPYHLPPVAKQTGTHRLYTNFNTILSSFYENGTIQFVKNDIDPLTGHAGIYHGFIKNIGTTNDITSNIIADDSLELAFPAIVYVGKSLSDDDALISFNHASNNHYPGNSAVFYKNGSYSNIVTLKMGESVTNYTPAQIERWGDYTGAQRRFNRNNEVWVGASFGKSSKSKTWISCLWVNEDVSTVKQLKGDGSQVRVYPNPASAIFSIEFNVSKTERCRFELFDQQGRSIRLLLNDMVEKGKNIFTFNQSPLASGIYFLNVTNERGNLLTSRKIIFQK